MLVQKSILLWSQNTLFIETIKDLLEVDCDFNVDISCEATNDGFLKTDYSILIALIESQEQYNNFMEFYSIKKEPIKDIPSVILLPKNVKVDAKITTTEQIKEIHTPFSFNELKAHTLRLISEFDKKRLAVFRIGCNSINPTELTSTNSSGKTSKLTQMELTLLMCLYKAKGKVLSREHLLQEVWGYNTDIITKTLDTHIHWLRQKIEPNPVNPQYLLTEEGGYRIRC